MFLYYNHEEANLDVVVLENDDTPAMNPDTTPILLLDLWEHAFYLDVSERYCMPDTRTNRASVFETPIRQRGVLPCRTVRTFFSVFGC